MVFVEGSWIRVKSGVKGAYGCCCSCSCCGSGPLSASGGGDGWDSRSGARREEGAAGGAGAGDGLGVDDAAGVMLVESIGGGSIVECWWNWACSEEDTQSSVMFKMDVVDG